LNIGYEIVNRVLVKGDITTPIGNGFTLTWLNSTGGGSEVIFTGTDRQAYEYLLKYYAKHHTVPSIDIFRENFPAAIYPLTPLNSMSPSVNEIIDVAAQRVNGYLVADLLGRAIDLHDKGQVDRSISLLKSESARIGIDLRQRQYRADDLNDAAFDIEELLSRTIEPGVPLGIDRIDTDYYGFQPGQLISLLGRQKAGKTTFMLNSALAAWEAGYDVLFFSVEMDTDMLRQRLYSMGAHTSPARFRRGQLRESEKASIRSFHAKLADDNSDSHGHFYISKKKSMITFEDIEAEIEIYDPHVVYIDGFNFMQDVKTHKTTEDWQANENVANQLKMIALERSLVVVASTQVQEKQYSAKHGIEARTIQGGTGLLKASDLVVGLDRAEYLHTVSCVLSRYENFEKVVVDIDWETMTFEFIEAPELEDKTI